MYLPQNNSPSAPVFWIFLVLLVPLILPSPGWAAFSNYNSLLIGDQAAGMGGAYTSLDKDVSSLAFYNPATLVRVPGSSSSSAVGVYKKFDTVFGQYADITKAALRANLGFFQAIPSSTGSVIRFDNFLNEYTFSMSIVMPDYDLFKGDVRSSTSLQSTLNTIDESLWVGGALARKVGSNGSLGLTLYYVARNYNKSVSARSFSGNTPVRIYTEERNFTQNGLVAILGYHHLLSDQWKLGLSYRPRALSFGGRGSYFDSYVDYGGTGGSEGNNASLTTLSSNANSDVTSTTHIPYKLTLGVSQNIEHFNTLISMDLSYYGPEAYEDIQMPGVSEWIEHQEICNLNFGIEYSFNPSVRLRMGAYTNFSSRPDPNPTKVREQGDRVQEMGFSANIAMTSKNIQYTFGGYYTGGSGQSVQRVGDPTGGGASGATSGSVGTSTNPYQIIDKTHQVFTMLLGTSYLL